MAFDYAEMAAVALELLAEFGDAGTLHRRGNGSSIDADGRAAPAGAGDTPIIGMEIVAGTSMGLARAGAGGEEGGTRTKAATHLIAGLENEPLTGDTITLNGAKLLIKDVRTVRPTTVTICHFLSCGKP